MRFAPTIATLIGLAALFTGVCAFSKYEPLDIRSEAYNVLGERDSNEDLALRSYIEDVVEDYVLRNLDIDSLVERAIAMDEDITELDRRESGQVTLIHKAVPTDSRTVSVDLDKTDNALGQLRQAVYPGERGMGVRIYLQQTGGNALQNYTPANSGKSLRDFGILAGSTVYWDEYWNRNLGASVKGKPGQSGIGRKVSGGKQGDRKKKPGRK
ncbi:hypothetical protein DFP72DRAFT_1069245 [Ephemerocybe angulata]|uniref:DUF4247 domain-containing protein n=1 Tax=Ephemerocybe angulata TaxID=980116 RepID=A0A8H6M309_9AGAR|nr:hypothetical protein DFP72DRAFT_1069245 [Tulosesus angulatus]